MVRGFHTPYPTIRHNSSSGIAGFDGVVPTMNRLIRAIRITWSALCGLAAVVLVVLWVRSYWRIDSGYMDRGHSRLTGTSVSGELMLHDEWLELSGLPTTINLEAFGRDDVFVDIPQTWLGFGCAWWASDSWTVVVPHCFAIAGALTLAVLPWFRWRFTLRTLLIAITTAGMVLGATLWLIR